MITSPQNPIIKQICALRESKYRRSAGLTLVDGLREIQRALRAGIAIKHVVFCRKLFKQKTEEDFIVQAKSSGLHVTEVNDKVFTKVAFGDREDGILAIVKPPALTLQHLRLSKNPLVVVLESVEKPGNLGAVLRSCDGAGVEAVLVSDPKTDIYNPNVIRSSTGIVFSLFIAADTAQSIQAFLKQHQIIPVAATPHATQVYTKADFTKPTAFILGAEDKGLSPMWLNQVSQQVAIPMQGQADSLNVAVSAALLVYEARRQRS